MSASNLANIRGMEEVTEETFSGIYFLCQDEEIRRIEGKHLMYKPKVAG